MRFFNTGLVLLTFAVFPVLAQPQSTVPSAQNGSTAHAIESVAATVIDSAVPAPTTRGIPGANFFSEKQVRTRLENDGFTHVMDLKRDKDGIWRGTAIKRAKQVSVGLDFKGNIITQ